MRGFLPGLRRSPVPVERLPVRFVSDDRRVITRSFFPGGEPRIRSVMRRVQRLSDEEVEHILAEVLAGFQHRHRNLPAAFEQNYRQAAKFAGEEPMSEARRRLLGAYFTMEYSFASAALFNPSIVPHPDQSGVPRGGRRFIMSLRATGEGHISSIVFRTGLIGADGSVMVEEPRPISHRARISPDQQYDRRLFRRKLLEMNIDQSAVELVMARLPERFNIVQLEHAIQQTLREQPARLQLEETTNGMHWLARENYELAIDPDAEISEVVIFPQSDNESRGIEDLRLVPYVEDDGTVTYYGTYTAYNGFRVLPQLIETTDFHRFDIHTLNGKCVQNKGMALFPRRIDGHFCMCSRIDGENLFIMYSDLVHFWEDAEVLRTPKHAWEFVQIGNCGSPLETPAGWLLLTHGVGPMRSYCIGAMLLDLEDPLKVIGHLDEPLIMPTEEEREGYVPNVVYTCGAMVVGEHLVIPYAMSDTATGFARVRLKDLLERLAA